MPPAIVPRLVTIATLTGPDAARLMDVPEPAGPHPRADGERLLVEVRAAAIAFPDLLQSRGLGRSDFFSLLTVL